MTVPATWPAATTSASKAYGVIILDEGTTITTDEDLKIDEEASLCVRVENLPDTADAILLAIRAAKAAYPEHPFLTCVELYSVAPLFGHTLLKNNTMIIGRMRTTSAGHVSKVVTINDPNPIAVAAGTTGSTGAVAIIRLLYRRPQYTITVP